MSISVSGLTKIYGEQKAIDDISFSINKGEIVGFLGPNGAGKSTTMKILSGFIPATSGTAEVAQWDIKENPKEVKKRLGYLPESNPLYMDMYVKEMLFFIAGLYGIPDKKRKVKEMIEQVGLGREQNKRIGSLSKGYKQRVGLARVLLPDPEVLILDEPTSGLDPNQLEDIRKLITALRGEKTVLLSTHIMQEVKAVCERAIIIHQGKIVADDRIEKLEAAAGETTLTVEFQEQVPENMWENMAEVRKIEKKSALVWILYTENPEQIKKRLWQLTLENNLNIVSLQSSKTSLEDLFKKLTH